jgi:hypothetical protein
MATPDGRVAFEAAGKSETLHFTTNRLCALEDKVGLTTIEVASELALGKTQPLGVSKRTLRGLYWAGAGERTLGEAGDLVDAIGHHRAVAIAIEAFDAAFPDAEDGDKKDADQNPPIAAAG